MVHAGCHIDAMFALNTLTQRTWKIVVAGLTDWDITSAWSTLAVFIVGAWAGNSTGAVVAALVMSGIAGAAVNASASIMGDFKTGYYTLAHPRALLCTQVSRRQNPSQRAGCQFKGRAQHRARTGQNPCQGQGQIHMTLKTSPRTLQGKVSVSIVMGLKAGYQGLMHH